MIRQLSFFLYRIVTCHTVRRTLDVVRLLLIRGIFRVVVICATRQGRVFLSFVAARLYRRSISFADVARRSLTLAVLCVLLSVRYSNLGGARVLRVLEGNGARLLNWFRMVIRYVTEYGGSYDVIWRVGLLLARFFHYGSLGLGR